MSEHETVKKFGLPLCFLTTNLLPVSLPIHNFTLKYAYSEKICHFTFP